MLAIEPWISGVWGDRSTNWATTTAQLMVLFAIMKTLAASNLMIHLSMFQKQCKGFDLYDKVFCHLDIIERDYFGLKYLDSNNTTQWLDPEREIKKQSTERGWKEATLLYVM